MRIQHFVLIIALLLRGVVARVYMRCAVCGVPCIIKVHHVYAHALKIEEA